MSQVGKETKRKNKKISNKPSVQVRLRFFCSNHSVAIQRIGIIVGIVIIVFLIPFIINELYKKGPGYITEWYAADVLSFYGSLLSCAGTVALGMAAIKQNDRAHKLSEQLQKLQQAELVSMVGAKDVFVERRNSSTPNFMNTHVQAEDLVVIDLTANEFSSQQSYHIDVKFENDSKYPIVQMRAHPGCRDNANGTLYGMQNWIDKAVYIPHNGNAWFRFIIPCKIFDEVNKYEFRLSIDFINVFDYTTSVNLIFPNLRQNGQRTDYKYRLSKFIDVKPT